MAAVLEIQCITDQQRDLLHPLGNPNQGLDGDYKQLLLA